MQELSYRQFVKKVSKRSGYLEYEVLDVINKMFLVLKEELQDDVKVKFDGFGRFHIKTMPPRRVRSPLLNKVLTTKPKRRVKFEVSLAYENYLNGK